MRTDAPILHVDVTQYGADPELLSLLQAQHRVHTVGPEALVLSDAVRQKQPFFACVEFDYPDIPRLAALTRLRREFPSLPIAMVTVEHSEALAVWALRARVWDYLVKPVRVDSMRLCLDRLGRHGPDLDDPPMPPDARFKMNGVDEALERAAEFVAANLQVKISQAETAARFGMTTYQLSRSFKRRFGVTFQEFVARHRIQKATQLLKNRSATVTDVCWSVGFRDLSYFTRVFRRYTGATPSGFRECWLSTRGVTQDGLGDNVQVSAIRPQMIDNDQ